jgi:alkanesulfonate monooxygenase SsuD/methylene tetrahydromethanopterin reductase-like flavin-dependent oxidoreductase (luciferase family)
MNSHRKFRFSVQEHRAVSATGWRDRARAIEAMGYSTLYLPDHLGDQMGPIAALMAAADATTTLRIGSLVFDNDYRQPRSWPRRPPRSTSCPTAGSTSASGPAG